jgi:hypothetical protein
MCRVSTFVVWLKSQPLMVQCRISKRNLRQLRAITIVFYALPWVHFTCDLGQLTRYPEIADWVHVRPRFMNGIFINGRGTHLGACSVQMCWLSIGNRMGGRLEEWKPHQSIRDLYNHSPKCVPLYRLSGHHWCTRCYIWSWPSYSQWLHLGGTFVWYKSHTIHCWGIETHLRYRPSK